MPIKGSENEFRKVLISEGTEVTTPDAGLQAFGIGTDGDPYLKDDAGAVRRVLTEDDLGAGTVDAADVTMDTTGFDNASGDDVAEVLGELDAAITAGGGGGGIGIHWAHVYRTTTQSIPNNTSTAIGFDAEVTDTDGYHDNSTNNSRITIPTGQGGLYLVGGSFFQNDTSTSWESFFRKNGATAIRGAGFQGTNGPANSQFTVPVALADGDYVEFMAFQGSGSAKLLGYGSDGADVRAQFWAVRIA